MTRRIDEALSEHAGSTRVRLMHQCMQGIVDGYERAAATAERFIEHGVDETSARALRDLARASREFARQTDEHAAGLLRQIAKVA